MASLVVHNQMINFILLGCCAKQQSATVFGQQSTLSSLVIYGWDQGNEYDVMILYNSLHHHSA